MAISNKEIIAFEIITASVNALISMKFFNTNLDNFKNKTIIHT
jgi:hypothetical protein